MSLGSVGSFACERFLDFCVSATTSLFFVVILPMVFTLDFLVYIYPIYHTFKSTWLNYLKRSFSTPPPLLPTIALLFESLVQTFF